MTRSLRSVYEALPYAAAIAAGRKAAGFPEVWLPHNHRRGSVGMGDCPTDVRSIQPQPGPQMAFLATPADIAVYGGAAGAGKSYALLEESLRHRANQRFGAVIFRKTYPQIMAEGGLWDTAEQVYPRVGAIPKRSTAEWVFPMGGRVKFAHMQYEDDRFKWDGAQIALLAFDQLEHFTWRQFFYMLARNRSTCGVEPYVRATCNPDPDHWLRTFMAWWIDDRTGLPIPNRSGVIRWFVMRGDNPDWADTPDELVARHGEFAMPKSFTFIAGNITDNRILLQQNPEYLANLEALSNTDRERLRRGNWNARDRAGSFFHRSWFPMVPAAPMGQMVDSIRYWDRAGTEYPDGPRENASWTAGVLLGKTQSGVYYVMHVDRFQGSPHTVSERIKTVASHDGSGVRVGIEQDPGQAGKAEAQSHARNLAGHLVTLNPVRESKGVRARPVSAQAEAGNIMVVHDDTWNEPFFRELENYDGSDSCVADQVDALSGAFYLLGVVKRAGAFGRRHRRR